MRTENFSIQYSHFTLWMPERQRLVSKTRLQFANISIFMFPIISFTKKILFLRDRKFRIYFQKWLLATNKVTRRFRCVIRAMPVLRFSSVLYFANILWEKNRNDIRRVELNQHFSKLVIECKQNLSIAWIIITHTQRAIFIHTVGRRNDAQEKNLEARNLIVRI